MDIRWITPTYAVSPQIDLEDMQAIKDAGITTIICNRPDAEVSPEQNSVVMAEAAEAAGLGFAVLPVTHDTLKATVPSQAEALANAPGPVLAYCASGTRSTFVWALGRAGQEPASELTEAAAKAGYDLTPIVGALS